VAFKLEVGLGSVMKGHGQPEKHLLHPQIASRYDIPPAGCPGSEINQKSTGGEPVNVRHTQNMQEQVKRSNVFKKKGS